MSIKEEGYEYLLDLDLEFIDNKFIPREQYEMTGFKGLRSKAGKFTEFINKYEKGVKFYERYFYREICELAAEYLQYKYIPNYSSEYQDDFREYIETYLKKNVDFLIARAIGGVIKTKELVLIFKKNIDKDLVYEFLEDYLNDECTHENDKHDFVLVFDPFPTRRIKSANFQ